MDTRIFSCKFNPKYELWEYKPGKAIITGMGKTPILAIESFDTWKGCECGKPECNEKNPEFVKLMKGLM